MRKEFAKWIEDYGRTHPGFVFLTGDLGFQALENVRDALGERFVNMGVAEQNMISVGAALAQQGLTSLCYSIAPFAVFRPCEQIRLNVGIHNLDVKIVGNGGGYGYGIMGATHHAIEDLAMLSSFQNMICYVPFCNEEVPLVSHAMMSRKGPAYLRLGFGVKPAWLDLPGSIAPMRKLTEGESVTIVGTGPVLLNALDAAKQSGVSSETFVVTALPLAELSDGFVASVKRTGCLLIVEEHVRRGGLGEMIALQLLELGIQVRVKHHYALGYPNKRYGSQKYHQGLSGLDAKALATSLSELASRNPTK